ncbi:hypothetical protein EV363DRAFT_561121 [Boletus edulis]|nr:hypothetical protein EV363DRAFT_561121 [Boletus edulis]
MILRVYAIWGRSKTILCILLFIYVLTGITAIVLVGIYDNHNIYLLVTIVQVLDFSLCSISFGNVLPSVYLIAPQLVLNAGLMFLVVFQSLKQSFEVYKATKQWQSNRYMQQLLRDGILYFVMNVVNDVVGLVRDPTYNASFFLDPFVFISFSTLVPRFIIGIRELYDRDIRGHFDIDTGFGCCRSRMLVRIQPCLRWYSWTETRVPRWRAARMTRAISKWVIEWTGQV